MTPLSSSHLRDVLLEGAREAGFELAGIAPLMPSEHTEALDRWLAAGHHGTMGWMADPATLALRGDPARFLHDPGRAAGLGSALVVAHSYFQPDPPGVPANPSRGVIARYARGRDYHRVVKQKLRVVVRHLEEAVAPHPVPRWRMAVDSAPVLERELARRAGLGWFGRNTMLLHPRVGSYFFLGVLLLDAEVEPDAPFERDHCGSCRACLDACPTGALLGRDADGAPVMDARRCISYLTIEHRGPIPVELREAMGNRVYGCDICQEACPFPTRFAEPAGEPGYAARGPGEAPVGVEALPVKDVSCESSGSERAPAARPRDGSHETHPGQRHPGTDAPSLVALLRMALDPDAWEAFSRGSAIRRAGRAGFARNVCVAIGNWLASARPGEPPEGAVDALAAALFDPEPLVRGHAAWALGRVGGAKASELLDSAASVEADPWVLEELDAGV